jgi:glycolate oxidase iron-sulfur subunit
VTRRSLSAEADRCVKCGFCLPVCPTYRERQDEGDSPRGRVALVQGLVEGQLDDRHLLRGHIDRCLGCQACEPICPAGVRVTTLVDGARALHRRRLPRPGRWPRQWLLKGMSDPRLYGPMFGLLRWLQRRGILDRLALRLSPAGTLARLLRLLPRLAAGHRWKPRYRPAGPSSAELTLFLGCVARRTEPEVTDAAIRVLNRLGFAVRVPPRQVCCGAMHQHNGEPVAARRLALRNLVAFGSEGAAPILSTASGCASHLRAYAGLEGVAEQPGASGFAHRVTDISRFLCQSAWPAEIGLRPLPLKVAIHDPCSLRNGLRQAEGPYGVLRRIPAIRLYPLADNQFCCGAAGTYLLQQPQMSAALAEYKIESLRRDPPDLLVTSNPGCALQLAAGIRAAGLDIEVLHPVQLLERQMAGKL